MAMATLACPSVVCALGNGFDLERLRRGRSEGFRLGCVGFHRRQNVFVGLLVGSRQPIDSSWPQANGRPQTIRADIVTEF